MTKRKVNTITHFLAPIYYAEEMVLFPFFLYGIIHVNIDYNVYPRNKVLWLLKCYREEHFYKKREEVNKKERR
ncbi:MAG: hypothetical protein R3321_11920 [Nitrososphaeraceae archaeon]|nr:hypothetical protein [Nitrososphaeraceae archaeon]